MIAYTVRCSFDDSAVAEEWVAWLRDKHLSEVRAAGAMDAEVVRLDQSRETASEERGAGAICEVRYHFATREAFAVYERDHAPRLRAAGLKLFPPERGLRYERTVGEVVAQVKASRPKP